MAKIKQTEPKLKHTDMACGQMFQKLLIRAIFFKSGGLKDWSCGKEAFFGERRNGERKGIVMHKGFIIR